MAATASTAISRAVSKVFLFTLTLHAIEPDVSLASSTLPGNTSLRKS